MMMHIDVSSVLRQTVSCELYSNLVTRPTGAAVRTQIEALLADSRERSLTVIDFSHVGMIDFSCADEVIAKLLLRYANAERGDRWDDAEALEEAVVRGVSRFRDPGRGQGLAGVRRYVGRWDGKVSVRSGRARIAIVPSWDDDVPLQEKLAPFPGSQVQVTIPERVAGGPR